MGIARAVRYASASTRGTSFVSSTSSTVDSSSTTVVDNAAGHTTARLSVGFGRANTEVVSVAHVSGTAGWASDGSSAPIRKNSAFACAISGWDADATSIHASFSRRASTAVN